MNVDPTFGKFPAFLTKINDIHFVFVFAFFAVLLFDFPLNRQAVTIPTWDIAGVFAHHLLTAHDHILEDFVQRMTNMQMSIRIRRAIMQGKGRTARRLGAQLIVNANLGPLFEPLRLALGQAGTHWEIRFRQVQRLFILGCLGGHVLIIFHRT